MPRGADAADARGDVRGVLIRPSQQHRLEKARRFRHFQVFEGEIEVPVGFSADELVVEVKPKSNKLAPAVEHFAWSPGEPADR